METAELLASRGRLLSCFLTCAVKIVWEFCFAMSWEKYLTCLIFFTSRGKNLKVCGRRENLAELEHSTIQLKRIAFARDFTAEILAFLVILLRRPRRWRNARHPKIWARDWILKSRQQGVYPTLLRELNAEDSEAFRQFHRLNRRESFETRRTRTCEEVSFRARNFLQLYGFLPQVNNKLPTDKLSCTVFCIALTNTEGRGGGGGGGQVF